MRERLLALFELARDANILNRSSRRHTSTWQGQVLKNTTMDMLLKDKMVLVTGGAKGVGAAICRAVTRESALSVIVDHDLDAGESLQNSCNKTGVVVCLSLW